jgi:hypothetical protein
MSDYSRLFHLTKDNKLKKAEKKSFELERKIKKIIHNNFSDIFASNLTLLTELNENYKIKYTEDKKFPIRIIDDLVFKEDEKTFYVFEYKKARDSNIIQQAATYRKLLISVQNNHHELKQKYNIYWTNKGRKKILDYEDFK